ncbi:cupin domain-containing protein [Variovorax sp. VNK109]|uniref:cupin domain-containing protein n=1 Tax=Variovorax sp. VNK109 TaxID=3400919 RepID=UPI003BFEAC28
MKAVTHLAEGRFKYKQAFDMVEDDTGGILDVPQVGQYRTQEPVPAHAFEEERIKALSRDTPTGFIPLDLSNVLGTGFAATTPLLLCRYLVLRPNERFSHELNATGQIVYVLRGKGESTSGGICFQWSAGDVFVFPWGSPVEHCASSDALLFMATDEPALAFVNASPSSPAPVLPAHFKHARIDERLQSIREKTEQHQAAGKFVTFYTKPMKALRSMLPAMNCSINTLEAGGNQRPHRHNAVAVTLSIQGEGVYSKVSGERVDWTEFGAFVTPPTVIHSHHNGGSKEMWSFVIQDSGFHSYCRTPGFAFSTD